MNVSPLGVRRVFTNAVFLFLAYVLPRILTVGAVVVAARVLGAENFGVYGTAAAYAVILSLVSTLGAMPLLVREIARDPARAPSLLRAAHIVKTVGNVVMLALLLGLAGFVLAYPRPVVAAATLLGVAYAIGSYVENLGAYFQAMERMQVWLGANAAYGLVTGGLGVVLVLTSQSVVVFCLAPVVGQLCALIYLAVSYRSGRPARGSVPADVRRFATALIPFAASFIALTIFYKVDVLLLTEFRSASEVGLYTAGYKFADITVALATVVATAMYPRLSRLGAGQEQERRAWAGSRLTELALLASVPLAASLWLLRAAVVAGVFGPGYEGATPVLQFIALALPALAVNIVAAYVLAAFGHMRRVALLYAGAVVVKVALNVLLIPQVGAEGAAIAMLGAEWLTAGAFVVSLRTVLGARLDSRAILAAAVAVAVAGPVAMLPTTAVTSTAAYGAAAIVVYWMFNVISTQERDVLRSALSLAPRWPR